MPSKLAVSANVRRRDADDQWPEKLARRCRAAARKGDYVFDKPATWASLAAAKDGALMARLNARKRAGIVASVLWALGAGVWQRLKDVDTAAAVSNAAYQTCITGPAQAIKDCSLIWDHTYDVMLLNSWLKVAWVALVPIPLTWLLAYVVIWTARWIMAGRQPPSAATPS